MGDFVIAPIVPTSAINVTGTTLEQIIPITVPTTTPMTANQLLQGETIDRLQPPTVEQWALIPMYKTSQTGKRRLWQVGFDGRNQLITIHGEVGGAIQRDSREVVPKAGRSMMEQALLEARHRYDVKYRESYRPPGVAGNTRIPAQLANKYRPPTLGKMKGYTDGKLKFPVAIQCKLDGIRARAFLEIDATGNEIVKLYSRMEKEFPHLEHIRQQLKHFFAYLPTGAGLDLELYKHGVEMNELHGWVSTTKTIHSKNYLLEAHVFDVILADAPYDERYMMLVRAYQNILDSNVNIDHIRILLNQWAYSHEDIIRIHDEFLEKGCEGLMIRHLYLSDKTTSGRNRSLYKGKRNNNLLKFKTFTEEEVTITGVTEGTGREEGKAIFIVRNAQGNTYHVRPAATYEEREVWFANPQQVINRLYTVRHFGLTVNDVHRFPVGKAFRDVPQRPGVMAF